MLNRLDRVIGKCQTYLTTMGGKKMLNCDVCKTAPAKYDAKTVFGPWANVCELCFVMYTSGKLGTGYGQLLVK